MRTAIARMLLAATMLVGVGAAAAPASAETAWQHHHPARHEINRRIARQEHRIGWERRHGGITRGQAHAMRAELRATRQEARADARADHHDGHLDRAQIHHLNHQLGASGG